MRRRLLISGLLGWLAAARMAAADAPARLIMDLSGAWDVSPQPSFTETPPSDAAWGTMYVPMLYRRDMSKNCYWFRRRIAIPSEWEGRHVRLIMEGACAYSTVFVNGKKLASEFTHSFPLVVDLTGHVAPGEEMELLIALQNSHGEYSEVNSIYFQRDENGRLICLYPGIGQYDIPGSIGIWQPIRLEATHPVFAEYQFIRTSYRKKTIEADVFLRNAGAKDATVEVSGTIAGGVNLPPKTVRIGARQSVKVTLSQPWENPLLWQPWEPNLYVLHTTIKEGGKAVDEIQDRFGFREFWIEGTDYYINGQRLYINLATFGLYSQTYWNKTISQVKEEVRQNARNLKSYNYNLLRWWFQAPKYLRDMADEEGMLVNDFIFGDQGEGVAVNKDWIYWKNAIKLFDRLFAFNCNHPSVFYWTIQNEGWINPKPGEWGEWLLEGMNACARHVMEKDPTRFPNSDGDGDMRGFLLAGMLGDKRETKQGLLPQFSYHFAVNTFDAAIHPANYYWLEQGKEPQWDRTKPLVLGEMGGNTMSIYDLSGFLGEGAWTMPNAFGHADGEYSFNVVKANRVMGLSGTKVWLINDPTFVEYVKKSQSPQIAIPREFDFHFYEGQTVSRRVHVINGLLRPTREVFNWALVLPVLQDGSGFHIRGGTADSGQFALDLAGGKGREVTLTMRIPSWNEAERGNPVRAEATWRLMYGAFQDEQPVRIYPALKPLDLGNVKIGLYDPEGTTAEALDKVVANVAKVTDLSQLEGFKVLVLGDESLDAGLSAEQVTQIRAFAEAGGRVVVLQQDVPQWPNGLCPVALKQDQMGYAHGRNFIVAPHHPVLKGIDDLDLRFWAPDYTVSRRSFTKPTTGPYRILIQNYHPRGLTTCSLVEIRAGAGLFLASQLDLVNKAAKSPPAGLLLQRLVQYAANYQSPVPPRAILIARQDSETAGLMLQRYGLVMERSDSLDAAALKDASLVVVDGSDGQGAARVQEALEPLAEFLKKGGTLVWHRAAVEDASLLSRLAEREVKLTPRPADKVITSFRKADDPLLDGISHMDLFFTLFGGWPAWPKQLNGIDVSVEVSGAAKVLETAGAGHPKELISDGALVRVPVGQGTLYVNQILWDCYPLSEKDQDVQDRQDHFAGQFFGNLGLASTAGGIASDLFNVPDDKAFQVNLRPFVNMAFKDDLPADGKGGWSDQGNNDMRYFPTGRQRFQGVPFDVIVPEENDNKAVITPAFLSQEQQAKLAEGFPINRKAKRLFIVHSSAWTPAAANLATWEVTYEDGSKEQFIAASPLHLHDWWRPYSPKDPGAGVAWVGRLAYPGAPQVAAFVMSWENPHPDKTIQKLTLKPSHGFYIVIAVTGERP